MRERLQPIFHEYSPVRDFHPSRLIDELERRHLFQRLGTMLTRPVAWRPTVDEYLACRHSQRSFSRDRMGPATTAAFDRAMRQALEDLHREGAIQTRDGQLDLDVDATATWGKPPAESSTDFG